MSVSKTMNTVANGYWSHSTTFMVDDWVAHTPKHILAKNFGIDAKVFDNVRKPDPYIFNSTVSKNQDVNGPKGALVGNSSYVFHSKDHPTEPVPGEGGTFQIIDSRNFPISTTIAAAVVTLKPKGLRELHWHPNVCHHRSPPSLPPFFHSFNFLSKITISNISNCSDNRRRRNGYTSTRELHARLFSLETRKLELSTSETAIPQSSPTTAVTTSRTLLTLRT